MAGVWDSVVRKTLIAMVVVAGGFLVGAPSASAQEVDAPVVSAGLTSGDGILSGNVVQVPLSPVVPIQICDNTIGAGVIPGILGGLSGCLGTT